MLPTESPSHFITPTRPTDHRSIDWDLPFALSLLPPNHSPLNLQEWSLNLLLYSRPRWLSAKKHSLSQNAGDRFDGLHLGDVLVGSALIELSPLCSPGFAQLDGWYHLMDHSSHRSIGQIKLSASLRYPHVSVMPSPESLLPLLDSEQQLGAAECAGEEKSETLLSESDLSLVLAALIQNLENATSSLLRNSLPSPLPSQSPESPQPFDEDISLEQQEEEEQEEKCDDAVEHKEEHDEESEQEDETAASLSEAMSQQQHEQQEELDWDLNSLSSSSSVGDEAKGEGEGHDVLQETGESPVPGEADAVLDSSSVLSEPLQSLSVAPSAEESLSPSPVPDDEELPQEPFLSGDDDPEDDLPQGQDLHGASTPEPLQDQSSLSSSSSSSTAAPELEEESKGDISCCSLQDSDSEDEETVVEEQQGEEQDLLSLLNIATEHSDDQSQPKPEEVKPVAPPSKPKPAPISIAPFSPIIPPPHPVTLSALLSAQTMGAELPPKPNLKKETSSLPSVPSHRCNLSKDVSDLSEVIRTVMKATQVSAKWEKSPGKRRQFLDAETERITRAMKVSLSEYSRAESWCSSQERKESL
jgi:hypothetical protein